MKFSFVNPPLNQEVPTREKKKMIGASPPIGHPIRSHLPKKNHNIEVSLLDATAKNLTTWFNSTLSPLT